MAATGIIFSLCDGSINHILFAGNNCGVFVAFFVVVVVAAAMVCHNLGKRTMAVLSMNDDGAGVDRLFVIRSLTGPLPALDEHIHRWQ